MKDAFDFLPELIPVLDNYISRGTDIFFSQKLYVDSVYSIAEVTLNNEDCGDLEYSAACELMELILIHGKGRVDEYIPK